jgi:signal transduction histidine kinase
MTVQVQADMVEAQAQSMSQAEQLSSSSRQLTRLICVELEPMGSETRKLGYW